MLVIAHRGASAVSPENTPEAFETADRLGADGVELDVRLAPDGRGGSRLVVHHDVLPGAQAALDDLPSFDEVLDACGDRMLVNVEIKNHADEGGFDPTMAMVPPTLAAMRARGRSWVDRFLISSFTSETVDHCRRVAPEFATALLTMAMPSLDELIASAASAGHRAIHPWHPMATAEFVDGAHAAGLTVNVWTANEPPDLLRLDEVGVDGACTDVPDVALGVLGRGDDPVELSPSWWPSSDPGRTPA
ncbi:MAG: glycerophosphodiester phosphodiesterase [Actinomycetota bacterium]